LESQTDDLEGITVEELLGSPEKQKKLIRRRDNIPPYHRLETQEQKD
jgi:hypothetical protein